MAKWKADVKEKARGKAQLLGVSREWGSIPVQKQRVVELEGMLVTANNLIQAEKKKVEKLKRAAKKKKP